MPIETERARAMRLARTARYKAKHRPAILLKSKEYREKNKHKAREHYLKNAEKIKARSRLRNSTHKDQIKVYRRSRLEISAARTRNWRNDNRDLYTIYQKNYRQKNRPILYRAIHKRRALKKKGKIGCLSVIYRWEKKWRHSESVKCYWCLKLFPGALCHCDHVIPISKGGSHSIDNLCISCSECNKHKHALTLEIWNKRIQNPVLL